MEIYFQTAFGISMIRNIAILNRIPVAFFSLEMSSLQFMNRFLSNVSSVELNRAELYSKQEHRFLDDAEKILRMLLSFWMILPRYLYMSFVREPLVLYGNIRLS